MRTRTGVTNIVATVIVLGLATGAQAAPPCSTSMVTGVWASTSFRQGQAPRRISICLLEFNRTGRLTDGSCFGATSAERITRPNGFAGHVSVSPSCVLTGKIRFDGDFIRVGARLDPARGVLTFTGAGPSVTYFRQW